MKIVCAWCRKDMGEKEPIKDTKISHSICPQCMEVVLAESGLDKVEILDEPTRD